MTRVVKEFLIEPEWAATPDVATMAPDYWNDPQFSDAADYGTAADFDEFLRRVQYKPGDVVWVEVGPEAKRARIIGIYPERDRHGFRRPKFRVQFETQAGTWSKNWEHTHPGFVQRGYQKARK